MRADPTDPLPSRRGVRTTTLRSRTSAAQEAALRDLLPRYGLPRSLTPGDLDHRFGRRAPRMLDIGVGNGVATLAHARTHPHHDVVAVELHRPGVAALTIAVHDGELRNIAIAPVDASELLPQVEPGTFDGIRVLFPDPWPKARHRKRRLVDESFVRSASRALRAGGSLHLATDWADYADQMRAALSTSGDLEPVVDHDHGPVPVDASIHRHVTGDPPRRWRSNRPDRPVTVYEQRGLDAGREITDLLVLRRS